jgi:thioester reductase-like protein
VLLTEVGDKILDLRVYIYRPGSISGCSATGAANIEAYINKLLVGITTLGYYPNSKGGGAKIRMDWAPVDYVAKSIVHIGRSGPMFGIFHMNNPYSIYSITMDRLANYIRRFDTAAFFVRNIETTYQPVLEYAALATT